MKNLIFTTDGAVESFCVSKLPEGNDIEALSRLFRRANNNTNFKELITEFNGYDEYAPIVCAMILSEKMTDELYCQVYEAYANNKKVLKALRDTKYKKNHISPELGKKVMEKMEKLA